MRLARSIVVSFLIVLLSVPAAAQGISLWLSPSRLPQGQPLVLRACLEGRPQRVVARLDGCRTLLMPGADGCYYGAVAVDLKLKPGPHQLRVLADGRSVIGNRVLVWAHDYGVRRITVDPKFLKLRPRDLARHKREMARQRKVYASLTPRRLWRGPFIRPVPGKVVGPFGRRSLINGQPRSPHGGVDLKARKGDPVRATAAGRVALVDDTYFGGLVVLIDHGQGIISAYRHLSKALVKPGQMVAKGQVIGLVGASGRVTGPHLHFDIHLGGARVDPLAWIKASRRLYRLMRAKRGES